MSEPVNPENTNKEIDKLKDKITSKGYEVTSKKEAIDSWEHNKKRIKERLTRVEDKIKQLETTIGNENNKSWFSRNKNKIRETEIELKKAKNEKINIERERDADLKHIAEYETNITTIKKEIEELKTKIEKLKRKDRSEDPSSDENPNGGKRYSRKTKKSKKARRSTKRN